jgi:hypothetical protein
MMRGAASEAAACDHADLAPVGVGQPVARRNLLAGALDVDREPPVQRQGLGRGRRQLRGLQRGGQRLGQCRGAVVGQQRVDRRGDGDARRRRLGELRSESAGIAAEGLRQVAAGREREQRGEGCALRSPAHRSPAWSGRASA